MRRTRIRCMRSGRAARFWCSTAECGIVRRPTDPTLRYAPISFSYRASIYPRTNERLLQRVMINVRYCPASLLSRSGAGTRVGSGVATAQFSPRDPLSREHFNALPVRRAPLSPLPARCFARLWARSSEQMLVCAGGGPGALRVFGAGHQDPSLSDAWSLSAAADQVEEDDTFDSESAAASDAPAKSTRRGGGRNRRAATRD